MKKIPTFEIFMNESLDQYSLEVLKEIKNLVKRSKSSNYDENYWDEYATTKVFADIISVEKMNHKTPKQAASSIHSMHE
jgi:hypothetical protein